MHASRFLLLFLAPGLTLGCSDPPPTMVAEETTQERTWVSDQASLTITADSATLRVLASGDCVGSYGQVGGPIPAHHFSLPGSYTQLIGAYPGRIDYAAHYEGQWDGNRLTLTVTVAALQQPVGPFHLTSGLKPAWPQCLYP
jgi:hypothetical protein